MNNTSTTLKWVSGGLEFLLGVPLLGAFIVISTGYSALFFMAILHIVTIVFASRENEPKGGNILGLITSLIAWIPFVGMFMHMVSAIVILIDAYRSQNRTARQSW
ncbi:hypothetical protein A8F94_24050 [Bacillus sp. FJAT-27225]|uniref:hypothetical protein n=1 Tax=Bacillus sp. FJAT-27225 TaxID=1743144 RepID=UPI00080C2F1C|nr:hypothetical protein [Bacillus sp. FJAT-27225]OCA88681.1 hypothetical protein A8F94_24050 [Bacillus sp. FJAT-27225]